MYKYNEDKLPHIIGEGPQGPPGEGAGNTGTPFLLTGTSGGASTYSNSNSTIYFNWSGVAGTYHLTLPSATSEPYRLIRIINSGSISASDKIHVVAPGLETIDGVDEYVLNKPYSGMQAWSNGSNWIVVQAKSH